MKNSTILMLMVLGCAFGSTVGTLLGIWLSR